MQKIHKDLKFAAHVLFHPLDGFWDLKREKKGRLYVALLFTVLWFFTNIFMQVGYSFSFNLSYGLHLDIIRELRSVGLIFILFCTANWSVTTLMDGKGFLKDIMMVFGYACLPMTILRIPAILLSNVLSADEGVYINVLFAAAWVWFIALLFFGIMQVHEYSFSKTVGTSVLTICSMLIIVFICMIFYNIFAQMAEFCTLFFKELFRGTGA